MPNERDPAKTRADLVIDGSDDHERVEQLEGGTQSRVHRDGDTIRRRPSRWSRSVLDLLGHLETVQFAGSPRPIGSGFDDEGNEMLGYMPGESPHPSPWTDTAIVELGQMLAHFHQVARSYQPPSDAVWQDWYGRHLGDQDAGFGHGDLGPWNIIAINGSPVGFIDWDTAGPMDPLWELAQFAWLNVQLHDDEVAIVAGLGTPHDRARQLALLLDSYGLAQADRTGFVDKMVEVAVHDSALQAREQNVNPDTLSAVSDSGYPFAWGMAWRIRGASWMLQHRNLLEAAIA